MSRHMDKQKADQWRVILTQYHESGLSISEYCRVHQVAVHQFHYWRKKLNALSGSVSPDSRPVNPKAQSPADFISLQLVDPIETTNRHALKSTVEIRFPSGVMVSITSDRLDYPAILKAVSKC